MANFSSLDRASSLGPMEDMVSTGAPGVSMSAEYEFYENTILWDNATFSYLVNGNSSFGNLEEKHRYSVTFKVVSILILIILMIILIGVNSLVVFSFLFKHIPRTRANFYMFQLAIADLSVGFVMPFNIISIAFDSLSDSTTFCMVETGITIFILVGSVCCILGLTIDRLQALHESLNYIAEMTQKQYIIRTLSTWFFPFVLCFILPMFWHNALPETPVKACYTLYILKREFSAYIFLPMVFIIFTMVAIVYIPILKIAVRHSRSISSTSYDVHRDIISLNKHMKSQLRILKTTTMVLCPLFGGWMPWVFVAAHIVYRPEEYKNPGMLFQISQFISYPGVLNSGINPIIYAARMPEYRNAFKALLRCNHQQVDPQQQVQSTTRSISSRGGSQKSTANE